MHWLMYSQGAALPGTFTASQGAVFAAEEPDDPGSSTAAPRTLRAFLEEERGHMSEFERFDPATAAAEAAMKRLEASSSAPGGAEDAREGADAAAARPDGAVGDGDDAAPDGEDGDGDTVMADAEADGGGDGVRDEAIVIPMAARATAEEPVERKDEGMEEQGAQGCAGSSGLSGSEGGPVPQESIITEPSAAPASENDPHDPKKQQQQQQQEQHVMRGNEPEETEAEGLGAAYDDGGCDEPENPAAETYR